MEVINIAVDSRSTYGKGAARKLRASGKIPAVVYRGGRVPDAIAIDPNELELKVRRLGNRNALIRLVIEGQERLCLIKGLQRHPLFRRLLHVDFYEVERGESVVVRVRLDLRGRAEGTRAGGTLKQLRTWLDIRCMPHNIPGSIEVDVTALNVGEFIRVADIKPPEGIEILFDANFNVVTVAGKLSEIEDEKPEVEV